MEIARLFPNSIMSAVVCFRSLELPFALEPLNRRCLNNTLYLGIIFHRHEWIKLEEARNIIYSIASNCWLSQSTLLKRIRVVMRSILKWAKISTFRTFLLPSFQPRRCFNPRQIVRGKSLRCQGWNQWEKVFNNLTGCFKLILGDKEP